MTKQSIPAPSVTVEIGKVLATLLEAGYLSPEGVAERVRAAERRGAAEALEAAASEARRAPADPDRLARWLRDRASEYRTADQAQA